VFWHPLTDGVAVAVKVHPRSRRPGVHGIALAADGERLRIGVIEAAEGGRANRAVCAVLATALGTARSAVRLRAGATSREKVLHVTGDPTDLASRLAAL
jgi:uncharacterized protein YggU (UPF0235/DUF167 family)